MSSTSSSDCECCDCSQYTYSLENNRNVYGKLMRGALESSRHVPLYATMAHPYIYYAEVQPPLNRRRGNDQPKKDNPFKKAFKWYTQERCLSNKNAAGPEKVGFADWLDSKYVEYLVESGLQPEPPITNCHPCPPCPEKARKFARIKSPWSKRRRPGNDSGDVPEKCTNKSCEFLLKPKDLSRAASENYTNTPTSGGKSNATVTSSNMPCNAKCSMRSHSLSDVGKSVPKYGETVPQEPTPSPYYVCHQEKVDQMVPSKKQTNQTKMISKRPQEKVQDVKKVPSKTQNLTNQPSTICKCPIDEVPDVKKVPSKKQNVINQPMPRCKCNQEKVSEAEQLPTEEGDSTNQPKSCFELNKEKQPEIQQIPSQKQTATNHTKPCCKCTQKNGSEEKQEQSKEPDSTNKPRPPSYKGHQQKQMEVEQVPPKEQILTNQHRPGCKKNVLEVEQGPSKQQDPTNQSRSPCSNNQEKVPEVVQVPSQSRTVEKSCQFSQEKVVPVHEETQYEPARPQPPRSIHNVRVCSCNICQAPIPPPTCPPLSHPMLCLPLMVQTSTITNPEICYPVYTITAAQSDVPKKQIRAEKPSRSCKAPASCPNNCHEVSQVFGPIPIQRQSYSTVAMNEETGEFSIVKEVAVVSKFTRSVTCVTNEAAQTSDHSIQFDKDGDSGHYPLFFKIIYGDVLNNECCNDI